MLEKIREGSQGVVAKTILGVVILSFALAGIGSYLGGSSDVPAAVVNDQEISSTTLEQAFAQERSRMENQFGEMFQTLSADAGYMARVRQNVLDRLVAEALIDQLADKMEIRVGDDEIKQSIRKMPEFQQDGVFDNDRYLSLVRRSGYRVDQFREMLRQDMTRRQLMGSVISSDFVLDNEVAQLQKLQQQLRDIRYISLNSNDFASGSEISDEAVEEYYAANTPQFETPEQLSLYYVELKADDLTGELDVDEQEIVTSYEENQQHYVNEARRKVSHILFAFNDDEAAAKAKADAALIRVNAGEDFAELAKELSEDTFSGENGGDLDWIDQGVMDPAFDEAAFAMSAGDVSEAVKSAFGYHVIKVTDVEERVVKPLDEVREEIRTRLLKEKAQEKFYEVQQQLAELSFEVPENLDEAAQAVNAKVQESPLFGRNGAPAPFNNPLVANAAFGEQVLIDGLNSDLIELSPEHVIVVRLKEHRPVEVRSLESVKAQIVATLQQQNAAELAKQAADEYLAQWEQGQSVEGVEVKESKALTRQDRQVDGALVRSVFSMAKPEGDKLAREVVAVSGGYAVVELMSVTDITVNDDAFVASLKERLSRSTTDATYRALIESLKNSGDVRFPQQQ